MWYIYIHNDIQRQIYVKTIVCIWWLIHKDTRLPDGSMFRPATSQLSQRPRRTERSHHPTQAPPADLGGSCWEQLEVSMAMGVPMGSPKKLDGLWGKNHETPTSMDDDWGYFHLRKPPAMNSQESKETLVPTEWGNISHWVPSTCACGPVVWEACDCWMTATQSVATVKVN